MKRVVVFAFVVAVVAAAGVQAQQVQEFYLTVDRAKQQKVYRAVQPDTYPADWQKRAQTVFKGRATWNVHYDDQDDALGVGFDHATEGLARRNVVAAVMAYLDGVLNESGTVNINFGTSETDGGGALAYSGPSGTCTDGCQNGFAFVNLTTGADPNPGSPEMNIYFDFGYTWYTGAAGGCPAGEHDMFSTVLHEMGHGLGLTSFTTSDGTSFGLAGPCGSPGNEFYSGFDDFIHRTTGGVDLYSCTPSFNGVSGDMTGNDLDWRGPLAVAAYGGYPGIYAPAVWDPGSSIAHWDDGTTGDPVMLRNISAGVERRQLLPFEIQALGDIGYDNVVPVELMGVSVE